MRARSRTELEHLAADAAADHLDRVAERGGGRVAAAARAAPPRPAAQRCAPPPRATKPRSAAGVGPCGAARRARRGPPPAASRRNRARRLADPRSSARAAARAGRRAAPRSRRARPRAASASASAASRARVERAPARLESLDGARHVAALARQQPLRDLEGARRDAVTTRDRQRQALADAVVVELVARRAGGRVDVERRHLERRLRERERLHLREVGREDEQRAARQEVGQDADRERRALDRIGAGAGLVEQHEAARAGGARDRGQVRRRAPVKVERSRSIDCSSPMSASTAVKHGRRAALGDGDEEPGLRHAARTGRASSARRSCRRRSGPVIASPRWPARSAMSTGTTGRPLSRSSGWRAAQQRARRRRPAPGACSRARRANAAAAPSASAPASASSSAVERRRRVRMRRGQLGAHAAFLGLLGLRRRGAGGC